ncbi:transposase [Nitrosomonas sp. Nm34]|uniref:transposase n=1 Tax=Nitrosomonas sp. Nm34 TaxID=1881055 RepID=UPI000ACC7F89
MDNHYHLLIETNSPTLSKGIKYLNGTYTQYFNRQHQRVGHVFQGRFKAVSKPSWCRKMPICSNWRVTLR